jgi:hypothetical protein|nr:MAG TPA: ECF sigma factor [Caudoviricetes sp.]
MRADDVADLTRTEWARLIDECIHDRQWREIFKARWLDGEKFEPLAEHFQLSVRQTQRIVKACEQKIQRHI